MSSNFDVIICGSGSAGLAAATWLSRYGIRCKILEKRKGAMQNGQADGVQCRTVEMFESFGLADDLLRKAYHVLEVTFWSDQGSGLRRDKRTPDTQPGLSHCPHVILNQAVVNGLLIGDMHESNCQTIDYNYDIKSVKVDREAATNPDAYCVTVIAEKAGRQEVFNTKYVLGCDGAHSAARKSLGFKMLGDSTNVVWGVMDVYPRTNFPDIRKKVVIHSRAGTLMIVPREGQSLARFYIELPAGSTAQDVKLHDLQKTARQIFSPYTMDIAETFWWSAYSIGQRLADNFHQDYRVFLTGDACHTHSPKAGQGMNVSLQDGYNIGWKLGAVLTGQCYPELLKTYVLERAAVAAELIDFDRTWTKLFSHNQDKEAHVSPEYFSEQFAKNARYVTGLTAMYDASLITIPRSGTEVCPRLQNSALQVGMRFPSTQVVRFCDAKAMQLAKALPADGRWRIVIFAGDMRKSLACASKLKALAEYLDSSSGPVRTLTASTPYVDSFIEPIIIFSGNRTDLEQEEIPEYFWPTTGKWGVRDLHKTFFDDESYNSGHGHAYEFYGIKPYPDPGATSDDDDLDVGAVVIVRPDQYISKITTLSDLDGIGEFFGGFAVKAKRID